MLPLLATLGAAFPAQNDEGRVTPVSTTPPQDPGGRSTNHRGAEPQADYPHQPACTRRGRATNTSRRGTSRRRPTSLRRPTTLRRTYRPSPPPGSYPPAPGAGNYPPATWVRSRGLPRPRQETATTRPATARRRRLPAPTRQLRRRLPATARRRRYTPAGRRKLATSRVALARGPNQRRPAAEDHRSRRLPGRMVATGPGRDRDRRKSGLVVGIPATIILTRRWIQCDPAGTGRSPNRRSSSRLPDRPARRIRRPDCMSAAEAASTNVVDALVPGAAPVSHDKR